MTKISTDYIFTDKVFRPFEPTIDSEVFGLLKIFERFEPRCSYKILLFKNNGIQVYISSDDYQIP